MDHLLEPPFPASPPALFLCRLWQVEAHGQDFRYPEKSPWRGTVLLRTISGEGEVQLHPEIRGSRFGAIRRGGTPSKRSKNEPQVWTAGPETFLVLPGPRMAGHRCRKGPWVYWFFDLAPGPWPWGEIPSTHRAPVEPEERGLLSSIQAHLSSPFEAQRSLGALHLNHLWARWARADQAILDPGRRMVEMAVRRMHQALAEGTLPDLDALAETVGITPQHLRRLFRGHTGLSPKGYLDGLRLQRAHEAFRWQNATVTAVSAELGYSSPFHLSRAFTRHYGISPADVKRGAVPKQNPNG